LTEKSSNKICQDDYGLAPNSELLEQCIYDEKRKKSDEYEEFADALADSLTGPEIRIITVTPPIQNIPHRN